MFKTVRNRVWAFDAEWIPEPRAGRLLYDLSDDLPDADVLRHMWKKGGATEEDPTPLKRLKRPEVLDSLKRISGKREPLTPRPSPRYFCLFR